MGIPAVAGTDWPGVAAEQYRSALRAIGVSLWTYDLHADTLDVDEALPELLGREVSHAMSSPDGLALVHSRDRARLQKSLMSLVIAAAIDAPVPQTKVVFRAQHADGSTRWLESSLTASSDTHGAGTRVFGATRDITDHQEDRAARRTAEGLYLDVWNSLPASAAILDHHGIIRQTNPAWRAVANAGGGPRKAFVGTSYLAVARAAASRGVVSAEQVADGIAAVLGGEIEESVIDYTVDAEEHQFTRWYRMRAFALHRPARGAIVMHLDVTAIKAAERELQRLRDDLTHLQRLATLGELATSIAHELNQPLEVIMASASTARRFVRDHRPIDALTPIVDEILDATTRAAGVIRRARALVRREAVMESVAINTVVAAVTRLIASDLIIRQVTLAESLSADLPDVFGDSIQLQQVLLNLLVNAFDAVHDQPRERRCVTIATRAGEPGSRIVEMSVTDTGIGIAPGMRDRVFDAFVTSKRKGTGLGLAIVQAIVQAHGGRVCAESPVGGGAVFRVTLPIKELSEPTIDE